MEPKKQKINTGATVKVLRNNIKAVAFGLDLDHLTELVNKHWESRHPERHALIIVYDDEGNAGLYDSHTPNSIYSKLTPKIEAHRIMAAINLVRADPSLAETFWTELGCITCDDELNDNIDNPEKVRKYLPENVEELYQNACNLINRRVVYKRSNKKSE